MIALRRAIGRLVVAFRTRPPGPGPWGERVAARHLRRRGLRILERNVRERAGEIDIVALDGSTLVFVEVKTCLTGGRGHGFDRIDARKRRRLRAAAAGYLRRCRLPVASWRIDAVIVEYTLTPRGRRRVERVDWYPAVVPLD